MKKRAMVLIADVRLTQNPPEKANACITFVGIRNRHFVRATLHVLLMRATALVGTGEAEFP